MVMLGPKKERAGYSPGPALPRHAAPGFVDLPGKLLEAPGVSEA